MDRLKIFQCPACVDAATSHATIKWDLAVLLEHYAKSHLNNFHLYSCPICRKSQLSPLMAKIHLEKCSPRDSSSQSSSNNRNSGSAVPLCKVDASQLMALQKAMNDSIRLYLKNNCSGSVEAPDLVDRGFQTEIESVSRFTQTTSLLADSDLDPNESDEDALLEALCTGGAHPPAEDTVLGGGANEAKKKVEDSSVSGETTRMSLGSGSVKESIGAAEENSTEEKDGRPDSTAAEEGDEPFFLGIVKQEPRWSNETNEENNKEHEPPVESPAPQLGVEEEIGDASVNPSPVPENHPETDQPDTNRMDVDPQDQSGPENTPKAPSVVTEQCDQEKTGTDKEAETVQEKDSQVVPPVEPVIPEPVLDPFSLLRSPSSTPFSMQDYSPNVPSAVTNSLTFLPGQLPVMSVQPMAAGVQTADELASVAQKVEKSAPIAQKSSELASVAKNMEKSAPLAQNVKNLAPIGGALTSVVIKQQPLSPIKDASDVPETTPQANEASSPSRAPISTPKVAVAPVVPPVAPVSTQREEGPEKEKESSSSASPTIPLRRLPIKSEPEQPVETSNVADPVGPAPIEKSQSNTATPPMTATGREKEKEGKTASKFKGFKIVKKEKSFKDVFARFVPLAPRTSPAAAAATTPSSPAATRIEPAAIPPPLTPQPVESTVNKSMPDGDSELKRLVLKMKAKPPTRTSTPDLSTVFGASSSDETNNSAEESLRKRRRDDKSKSPAKGVGTQRKRHRTLLTTPPSTVPAGPLDRIIDEMGGKQTESTSTPVTTPLTVDTRAAESRDARASASHSNSSTSTAVASPVQPRVIPSGYAYAGTAYPVQAAAPRRPGFFFNNPYATAAHPQVYRQREAERWYHQNITAAVYSSLVTPPEHRFFDAPSYTPSAPGTPTNYGAPDLDIPPPPPPPPPAEPTETEKNGEENQEKEKKKEKEKKEDEKKERKKKKDDEKGEKRRNREKEEDRDIFVRAPTKEVATSSKKSRLSGGSDFSQTAATTAPATEATTSAARRKLELAGGKTAVDSASPPSSGLKKRKSRWEETKEKEEKEREDEGKELSTAVSNSGDSNLTADTMRVELENEEGEEETTGLSDIDDLVIDEPSYASGEESEEPFIEYDDPLETPARVSKKKNKQNKRFTVADVDVLAANNVKMKREEKKRRKKNVEEGGEKKEKEKEKRKSREKKQKDKETEDSLDDDLPTTRKKKKYKRVLIDSSPESPPVASRRRVYERDAAGQIRESEGTRTPSRPRSRCTSPVTSPKVSSVAAEPSSSGLVPRSVRGRGRGRGTRGRPRGTTASRLNTFCRILEKSRTAGEDV